MISALFVVTIAVTPVAGLDTVCHAWIVRDHIFIPQKVACVHPNIVAAPPAKGTYPDPLSFITVDPDPGQALAFCVASLKKPGDTGATDQSECVGPD